MAHWAEIDNNKTVIRVVVTDNYDPAGDEGYSWLIQNLGGDWVKTSYNDNFRKKFAGIGDVYDEDDDTFKPAKPSENAEWNPETWSWDIESNIGGE